MAGMLNMLPASCPKWHFKVVVIEHDLDLIWASDYVIDLGPGNGDKGGLVVAEGTPENLQQQQKNSATARALWKYQHHETAPFAERVYP